MCAFVVCWNVPQVSHFNVEIVALLQLVLLLQSIIQASVRNMAEGGASGPPDLISGMVQPVDLVNSVTR